MRRYQFSCVDDRWATPLGALKKPRAAPLQNKNERQVAPDAQLGRRRRPKMNFAPAAGTKRTCHFSARGAPKAPHLLLRINKPALSIILHNVVKRVVEGVPVKQAAQLLLGIGFHVIQHLRDD